MPSDKRNLARHFRSNMSLPEVLLWNRLKQDKIGFHIRRQYQFDQYILDFYCADPKLDIEIDGAVHQLKELSDARRDSDLSSKGVHILRLSAKSVLMDPDFAAETIRKYLVDLQELANKDASPDGEAGEERTG